MSQRTAVPTIRFDATLYTIDRWTIVRLPEKASRKLPSRGQVANRLREELRTIDPRIELFVADPSVAAWLDQRPPSERAAQDLERFTAFLVEPLPDLAERYAEEIRAVLREAGSREDVTAAIAVLLLRRAVLETGGWGGRADASTTTLDGYAVRDVHLAEVLGAERDYAVVALDAIVDAEFAFPLDLGEAWEAHERGELEDLVAEDEDGISGTARRRVRLELSLTAEYDPQLRRLSSLELDVVEEEGEPDYF
jgi:hypothetical protein